MNGKTSTEVKEELFNAGKPEEEVRELLPFKIFRVQTNKYLPG